MLTGMCSYLYAAGNRPDKFKTIDGLNITTAATGPGAGPVYIINIDLGFYDLEGSARADALLDAGSEFESKVREISWLHCRCPEQWPRLS